MFRKLPSWVHECCCMWSSFLRYLLERFVSWGLKYLSAYKGTLDSYFHEISSTSSYSMKQQVHSNHTFGLIFRLVLIIVSDSIFSSYILFCYYSSRWHCHFCFAFANTFIIDVIVTYKGCSNKKVTSSYCLQLNLHYTTQSYYLLF